MMNSREIQRWLLSGFLFGTGWLAARFVWSVLAGFMAVLVPAALLLILAWVVFSRLRPMEARRVWQGGAARVASAVFSGRGAVRSQVFRHR